MSAPLRNEIVPKLVVGGELVGTAPDPHEAARTSVPQGGAGLKPNCCVDEPVDVLVVSVSIEDAANVLVVSDPAGALLG